jgi:hypothetical protein
MVEGSHRSGSKKSRQGGAFWVSGDGALLQRALPPHSTPWAAINSLAVRPQFTPVTHRALIPRQFVVNEANAGPLLTRPAINTLAFCLQRTLVTHHTVTLCHTISGVACASTSGTCFISERRHSTLLAPTSPSICCCVHLVLRHPTVALKPNSSPGGTGNP